ncbi:MAG: magnesium transporter [Deltaproteobacteria bacterium]|jgi:magnesium transporter|nr:magnesium transporter [Deltaproteobacteria bacterium]
MSSEQNRTPNASLPPEAREKKQEASLPLRGLEDAEFAHPADVADHIETLPAEQRVSALESLPVEHAAETLTELEEHVRVELFENLEPVQAATLLAEMSPDDAADVLDELEEDHRAEILGSLNLEDAEAIRTLMAFDPDTAGGAMNTEIFLLNQNLTADMAIEQVRHEIDDKEFAYYAYVVDDNEVLVGVLSLHDLMLCKSGVVLRDILPPQRAVAVLFDRDKNEVAQILGRYNFMAVPVVDREGRVLGVVTHDDVIDIIQEAATEDMQGMVGAGQDESVDTPWRHSVRMRLPWLVVNMINSAFAAFVVSLFDGTIAQMTFLAVLMPIVANQAGNTGQQALAVTIRHLAVDRLDRAKALSAVLRETRIGLTIGIAVAVLVFAILGFGSGNWALAGVMSLALVLNMVVGAAAGSSIPLVLRALGRDPAQASSIFLTMITDSGGFFIFLGLATIVLL